MTTLTLTPRQRLINLAVWAAGEKAKQDLGLPSEWDQSDWMKQKSCGTSCCIAGKVALDAGATPVLFDDDLEEVSPEEALGLWTEDYEHDVTDVRIPGLPHRVPIREYARQVLDLNEREASRLFFGGNGLYDVIEAIRVVLERMPA